MTNIDDLIEDFNSGDTDTILELFGDYQTFFKVVDRRGRLDDIDFNNTSEAEYWENDLLLYFYEFHREKFYYWVKTWLDDIEFENDKVYCVRSDVGDFASLFCTGGRNDVSEETIESILKGDYNFDWYNDWDVDVYQNVIEDLNPDNLKILKERFIKELSGVEVSSETTVLEQIALQQGHDEYVTVDSSNIDEIFRDEETVKYLLQNELDDDFTTDLRRVYYYSEQSALESEYYDEVWSELTSDYFTGKPEYISRPHKYKKETTVEYVKLEIRDFDGLILDFLNDNKGYTGSSLLGYHGSFLGVLKESVECLSVRFPDYASVTDDLINSYFVDYF